MDSSHSFQPSRRRRRATAIAAVLVVVAAAATAFAAPTIAQATSGAGAASPQAAAARDPMKCERDPTCKDHQRAFDCNTQCTDDPACMERCSEVQEQTGTSAPH